ncbi:MAG TPA: 16S rRNA (guanine(527)-N(7))-methyltransferase RsmG [Vicinamibacterales bacterium]|nr:16S rRNA (guanine(527)-N(7))-methyltransferase RsmG [Vicinamibacterales bacterium]
MTARDFKARLARRGRRASVKITAPVADRLWAYLELLLRWNRKMNLTGFKESDADVAIDRLLIEPLVAVRHIPTGAALIDIGSGNGSPAIPIKLAVESLALVMVESKARKCAFLREALRVLDIGDATVENARFEELLARPDLHETQDIVTARALRLESRTLLGLQAFLKPGGRMLLFQTGSTAEPSNVPLPLEPAAILPLSPDTPSNRLVILAKRPARP